MVPTILPSAMLPTWLGGAFSSQPWGYTSIIDAIKQNLTSEAALDAVVARSFRLRMRAGQFDYPLDNQPYTRIPVTELGSAAHHELALDVAATGLVLLQVGRRLPETLARRC